MSVYKPPTKPFFLYDFIIKGRRFHGSTGQKTRRAAEAFEERIRREVAEGKHGEASQLTLDQAAGKWWTEKGQHLGEADRIEKRLEQLLTLIDRSLRLAEITTQHVNDAMQKRMGMAFTKSPAEDAKAYLPKNATVNRDVIDTLRPILNRAQSHWDAKGLNRINWKALRLATPAEHIRVYSAQEQAAWLAKCGPATGLALQMLLTYGLRFGELFFDLDAFEPDGPRLAIRKRKKDVPHIVPLLEGHAREIAARLGRARAADPPLPTIWYVETTTRKGETRLEPIPYYGMQARLNSAARRAKVTPGRLLHGTRHHAGTATLRSSKNLKLTQKLLGHKDIKSTMRYAHALEDDVREALEGRTELPAIGGKTDRSRAK